MKKCNVLILLMLSVLAITSCKKDKPESEDKSSIIVGKNWKLTAYTEDGQNALSTTYEACELDNIDKFFADGKLMTDEGATKCDPSDPQVYESARWKIEGDKLILSEESSSLQIVTTILELTQTTLKFSIKNPFGSETYIYIYTAQ